MTEIHLGIDIDTSDVGAAEASLDRFEGKLRGATGTFGAVAGASQKADRGVRGFADANAMAAQRASNAVAQFEKLAAVWVSLGALAGGVVIGGMVRLSDEYTEITNKLKIVASEQTNVNGLFGQLADLADEVRSPVGAIATLYQRAALNAKELGASQQDLIQFTENVGRALAIQGGSAEAASGALLQLSQALGSGTVHAEEFNSILEGALPIAQAAAKGIDEAGGSVAKLRSLVIAGKVSSDEFFKGILSQSEALQESFAKTTPTISQAFSVLHNNMVAMSRETSGIMSGLAQAIIFVGENLERLTVYAATAAAVFAGKFVVGLAMAAAEAGTLAGALGVLKGALITTGVGALIVGAGELAYQFLQLVKSTGSWGEALSLLGEVASGVWDGIKTSASAIGPALGAVWAGIKADFIGMVQAIVIKWSNAMESLAGISANVPIIGDDLAAKFGDAAKRAAADAHDLGDAFAAAQARAAALGAEAKDRVAAGFGQAAEAVSKLRDKVKEAEGGASGAAGAAGTLGIGLDKAAGSAKKLADELRRAKDVLDDQVAAHQRVLDQLKGAGVETGYVVDETRKIQDALDGSGVSLDAFLKTVGMTREEYTRMLGETEKISAQIDYQKKAAQGMVDALKGLAFGTLDTGEGIGGLFQSITDGAFGQQLDDAFKKAADTLSSALGKALSGLGNSGLSDFGMASVGTGIGIAAAGALNGNAQQIGGGIGSAIGGVAGDMIGKAIGGSIGSFAGPIGMVLGSVAGGFISKLFGGHSSWKDADVTAFAGTTYASDTTVRFNTANEGASPVARAAMVGTMNLLADFNKELGEYIDSLGGTMQRGTRLVVDQQKALEAITGYASDFDAPRDGRSEQAAAEIAAKVAEIMGLAATIAAKAGPELTNAQQLWRATQEKFSKENVAILKSLGFSARGIFQAQMDIRRDIAQGFNKEQLDALVDTGRATKAELDKWKSAEFDALAERRKAAIATAREIGADEAVVRSSFRAQRQDIVAQWREMLADISGATGGMSKGAMNRQMLDTLVDGGNAVKWQLNWWKSQELRSIEDRRLAAVKAAKDAGASIALVNQVFAGERGKIVSRWKELLRGLVDETDKAVVTVTRKDRLTFRGGALDEMVQGGNTGMLTQWRNVQRQLLEIERAEQIAEARKLGVDTTLIRRLYAQKLLDVEKTYAEKRYQAVVDAAASALDRLSSRLNGLESKRSEVLQELTQRAEEARRAEQALADARAGLAGGDLNPGGPLDRFRALQGQFGAAIKAARAGDSDAASQAASLAQSLLQAGRGVYASSSGYADLFKQVNQQLLSAQKGFDKQADKIEQSVDSVKIVEATERSTKALLTALGRLNTSIENVDRQIARQTRRQELAQQRQRVGVR